MLTLLSKIFQYFSASDGSQYANAKVFTEPSALLGKPRCGQQINNFQSSRPTGTGRRSNRDRKPTGSIEVVEQLEQGSLEDNPFSLHDLISIKKISEENDIRMELKKLPESIMQSYVIVLNAILSASANEKQIEQLQALKVIVKDTVSNSRNS